MKALPYLTIITLMLFVFTIKAQDVVPERTTQFEFSVNKLKYQQQIDNVKSKVAQLPYTSQISLSWNNYTLTFRVKEGGDYGNFDVNKIKQILLSEGVELVKMQRTVVKK